MAYTPQLLESAKKAAAYQAVADHLDASYRYIGIGSGSTIVYVVEAIASKGSDFLANMSFIPTGSQSRALIRAAGLLLCNLNERPLTMDGSLVTLNVAFDGADEVDQDLNCIKGGGACLLQEKLVAVAASKFVVVADSRKLSSRLCTLWKSIPIEVIPLAAPDILLQLKALGSVNPVVRCGLPGKSGECVTDNGMWIIDAPFKPLLLPTDIKEGVDNPTVTGSWEVGALASELIKMPGIVETGLFCDIYGQRVLRQKPIAAYFGMFDGEVVQRTISSRLVVD